MTESIDKLPAITNLSKKEKKILKDNLVKFHVISNVLDCLAINKFLYGQESVCYKDVRYTLVYSSRTMSLRTHQPFESAEKAVRENLDILSQKNILETENHRILVEDTDEGEVLRERVHDLKQLVTAYQLGWIPEARCEDHVW